MEWNDRMWMRHRAWSLLLSLGGVAIATGCATTPQQGVTAVEVWRGGDDVLTLKFVEALEEEFRANAAFVLSWGKKPGTLIVLIPSHVQWRQEGSDIRVTYKVEFSTSDSKPLSATQGSCLESNLSECAKEVVREAALIAAAAR